LPGCSCRGAIVLAGLIRWLEKPPNPLAMRTHDPKTKVVPASIAGKPKLKDVIESFDDLWREAPRWAPAVDVLSSGSPRGILRRVVMSRDSPRLERDGARNTRI
jgi:hypothetical protein